MSRACVLIVDDKHTIVTLLARILSPEFDVTTASDGTRALGLIAAQEFDVVVTDIRMPGADGMIVLQETRRQQPSSGSRPRPPAPGSAHAGPAPSSTA